MQPVTIYAIHLTMNIRPNYTYVMIKIPVKITHYSYKERAEKC
jgi:hypothetical protein